VTEQVATLDLVSDGRVEFGTGESGSQVELGGFGIPVEEKYEMWREATREVTEMMVSEPYPGYDSEHFEMEPRNVIPKPVQEPHPPLWMACSTREMIAEAARRGVGALCFAFTDEDEAEEWVDVYYETFREEWVPLGHDVNPTIAMVTGFSRHEDHDAADERGAEGFSFFQYGLAHYYAFGGHEPWRTNRWEQFQAAGGVDAFADRVIDSAVGTPGELREHLRGFADAGVDQVILVQQGGNTRHEHICESLELFAQEVMPEFHAEEEERLERKREELRPHVEAAMERRDEPGSIADEEAPRVIPYDRDSNDFTD
jgi:alkanesulfonate monooxygenase SsuD/methylene tetrahydromethanopterin reductase-like flavin-dependent oxidoreductase (luciferase family)